MARGAPSRNSKKIGERRVKFRVVVKNDISDRGDNTGEQQADNGELDEKNISHDVNNTGKKLDDIERAGWNGPETDPDNARSALESDGWKNSMQDAGWTYNDDSGSWDKDGQSFDPKTGTMTGLKAGLSKRGKKRAILAIAGFVGAAGSTALITVVVHGPMQLLHYADMIRHTVELVKTGQMTARSAANSARAAKLSKAGFSSSVSEFVQRSRVGILGGAIGTHYKNALERSGIILNSDVGIDSLSFYRGATIDAAKIPPGTTARDFLRNNGVPDDILKRIEFGRPGPNGVKIDLVSGAKPLDRVEKRLVNQALLRSAGINNRVSQHILSWNLSRMLGITGFFHPFENKVHKSIGQFNNWRKDLFKGKRKVDASRRAKVDEQSEKAVSNAMQRETNVASGRKIAGKAAKITGLVALATTGICITKAMSDPNVKFDGIMGSSRNFYLDLQGYSEQMKASDDWSMEAFDLVYNTTMHTEDDYNGDGVIDEHEKHSFGSGNLISIIDGSTTAAEINSVSTGVLDSWRSISKSSGGLYGIISSIPGAWQLAGFACSEWGQRLISWGTDLIGCIASLGLGCVAGIAFDIWVETKKGQDFMAGVAISIVGWFLNNPVNYEDLIDLGLLEEVSDATVAGGWFHANEVIRLGGGGPLSSVQFAAVQQEEMAIAKAEYDAKPLAQQLFDISDYRSAAVKVAKQFDFKEKGLTPDGILANSIKLLTSGTNIIAKAFQPTSSINIVPGAYAKSPNEELSDFFYGIKIPSFGFTDEEMDKWTDELDYQFDTNMDIVKGILDADEKVSGQPLRAKMKKCYGVNINKAEYSTGDGYDYRVSIADNNPSEGEDGAGRSKEAEAATLYYSEEELAKCSDHSDDDLFRVRTFANDYFDIVYNACFELGDASACDEAGFSGGGNIASNCIPIENHTGWCYPTERPANTNTYEDHGNSTDITGTGGSQGMPVYAMHSGKVIVSTDDAVVGSSCTADGAIHRRGEKYVYIVIQGLQATTGYFHMNFGSRTVEVGDTVVAGTQIGTVGNTGCSTGTHLHLQFNEGIYEPPHSYFGWGAPGGY